MREPLAADVSSSSRIVTVNGGSSSIKIAAFTADAEPRRLFAGLAERIGSTEASLVERAADGKVVDRHRIGEAARDAIQSVVGWVAARLGDSPVIGIGHRIVHGGLELTAHQRVTEAVLSSLHAARPLDVAHLPQEIALLKAFRQKFPGVPQVACFDTAFHHGMPRVAKLLPIPRRYDRAGLHRMGFHGLSYTYVTSELRRIAGAEVANGRVIIAHLGSGASMTALRDGQPIDTSMGFTPTAGLVMGTRSGDLDPGLLTYLMQKEQWTPARADTFLNAECGMAGISETGADMRELMARRVADTRAAEAIELFCYQARKWIGSFAAALGGLDTLVFTGGIGEHAAEVRASICQDLGFLGVHLDVGRNARSDAVISTDAGPVVARVIPTDEEIVIARIVAGVLGSPPP